MSPHPPSQGGSPAASKTAKRSPAQRVSPGQARPGNEADFSSSGCSAAAVSITGSSRSIWHPPSSTPFGAGGEDDLATSEISPSAAVNPIGTASAPLTCDICFKTFTSRSNLNKHKRVQHSGEEYLCPICKRTFKNRYYIKDHVNLCAAPHKKSSSISAATTPTVTTPSQMPPPLPAPEYTSPNHEVAEKKLFNREEYSHPNYHQQQQQQPTPLLKKSEMSQKVSDSEKQ